MTNDMTTLLVSLVSVVWLAIGLFGGVKAATDVFDVDVENEAWVIVFLFTLTGPFILAIYLLSLIPFRRFTRNMTFLKSRSRRERDIRRTLENLSL